MVQDFWLKIALIWLKTATELCNSNSRYAAPAAVHVRQEWTLDLGLCLGPPGVGAVRRLRRSWWLSYLPQLRMS